jgi:hypothetical protein
MWLDEKGKLALDPKPVNAEAVRPAAAPHGGRRLMGEIILLIWLAAWLVWVASGSKP